MYEVGKYQFTINGNVVDVGSYEMVNLILGLTVVPSSSATSLAPPTATPTITSSAPFRSKT